MNARRAALALVAAGLVAVLGGCSLFRAERPKPKPLEPIAAPAPVQALWNRTVGKVGYPATVAVFGGAVIVGNDDGEIQAFDVRDGSPAWRLAVGAPLAAGVGTDGRRVALVTRNNDLVVLRGGEVLWKKPVGSRVATAPLVAGDRVFVLAVDRTVQAYDGDTGARLWQVQRPGEPLALTEAGVLTAWRDTLVLGQGPRMVGLDPGNGNTRWDVAVGSPRGANEIERLADLVGPVARAGDVFCVRSFGSTVGGVDASRGSTLWTKPNSGRDPVAGDAELVAGADGSDRISVWKTVGGDLAWSNESLVNRRLGPPALAGASVAFGDEDGVLHWFARGSGQSQARTPTDGSPLAARPVVVDGTVVVVTRRGGVYAFRPG